MASIDSVLNAYLEDDGYSWQPTLPVLETRTGAQGLPIGRQKAANPLYQGTFRARFPSSAILQNFFTFWVENRRKLITWTCPDDSHVYDCRLKGDSPGYVKDGPEEHVVEFGMTGEY